MTSTVQHRTAAADRQTLDAVRPAVRDLLLSVPSFQQLSPEEQQRIASGMVKIASYMANPAGVFTPPLSSAQADAVEATKQRLSPARWGGILKPGPCNRAWSNLARWCRKWTFPNSSAA